MAAFERALQLDQLTLAERAVWDSQLSSDDKDFIWAVWSLFIEHDTRLPLVRSNTRCARELIKLLGGRPRFSWLAAKGCEWVGVAQSDKARDAEIGQWVEQFTSATLGADAAQGFDCTLLVRFICARKAAYQGE